jgi:hypothetical protein
MMMSNELPPACAATSPNDPRRMLRRFPNRSTTYGLGSMPRYRIEGRMRLSARYHSPSPHPISSTLRAGSPRKYSVIATTRRAFRAITAGVITRERGFRYHRSKYALS